MDQITKPMPAVQSPESDPFGGDFAADLEPQADPAYDRWIEEVLAAERQKNVCPLCGYYSLESSPHDECLARHAYATDIELDHELGIDEDRRGYDE